MMANSAINIRWVCGEGVRVHGSGYEPWARTTATATAAHGGSFREGGKNRKVFLYTVSPKRLRVAHMFNHGWWRLAVGGWWPLAAGSWQLAVGGW